MQGADVVAARDRGVPSAGSHLAASGLPGCGRTVQSLSSTTLGTFRENVEQQRIPPAPLRPGLWVISSGLCPPQEIGLVAT